MRLAREWKVRIKKKKYLSKIAEVEREGGSVILALPQTYMNRSGLAAGQLMKGMRIRPENIVVVYDDLDIPLGSIRVRKQGGPGTHKGMASVIQEIETTRFPRIRLGIGPLPPEQDATDYVLSIFSRTEKLLLEKSLMQAQEALEMILAGEVERAMNCFN
jgi:PTH1 family peptidyl-tRNA hydrolase